VISLIYENENISTETNLLENVDNPRRILEIPGLKENPDAEDVHQTVSDRNGDQITFPNLNLENHTWKKIAGLEEFKSNNN